MAGKQHGDFDVPKPNKGLEYVVRESDRLKRELFYTAMTVAARFMADAPRDSGRMAASTSASQEASDYAKSAGRPIGAVRVSAPYAVWRLTGAGPGKHTHSTGNEPRGGPYDGDYTFTTIIKKMGK